jgi:hypothetical protein
MLSVKDVNARLPLVRSIVRDVMGLHRDLSERRLRLSELRDRYPAPRSVSVGGAAAAGAGSGVSSRVGLGVYEQEVVQMESELARDESRMAEYARELSSIGGSLADAGLGQVDFDGQLGGERVLLSWQFDEPEVMYCRAGVRRGGERRLLLQCAGVADAGPAAVPEFGQSC